MRSVLLFLAALFILASCTKVIHVDLNSSNPQYVIEGKVTDAPGPYSVRITRSVNFSQASNYPEVANATVMISDNGGNTDTLSYSGGGYYATHHLAGASGHTYSLQVLVDGNTFAATDQMPQPVPFDSLLTEALTGIDGKKRIVPLPIYNDPAGVQNYYHFVVSKNGHDLKTIFYRDDRLQDGVTVREALRERDTSFSTGDHLGVEMQSISEAMHQYYYTLGQTLSQNAAAPANPGTNLSGKGVLGYFSANTVSRKDVIVH